MADFVDRYTYRVIWWEADREYVGLCAEFPLLSHLDKTPEKAFAGIRDLIAFCVKDLQKEGEPVPEPLSTKRYSGTITVRVPPDTHRALAMDAAEAGVSMNRLASERLANRLR
jgi:predicted RNase H-like HicB family nuclease